MSIDKETKTKLITEYQLHKTDTGSPEVQVAILSNRIAQLTDHLREHKHDQSSRRGLLENGRQATQIAELRSQERLPALP